MSTSDSLPELPPIEEAVVGSVGDRFIAVAAAGPSRTALQSPAGTWTYHELGQASGGVADHLRRLVGDSEVHPVAVLADHDGPLVIAIFGVILAGGAVLVPDPEAPAEQTARLLEECGVRAVLHDRSTTEAAEAAAARIGAPCTSLDQIESADPRATPRSPTDPVLLALSSGTTGTPKAASITHGVINNVVRGATVALSIGPDDRMPMLFPVSLAVAAYPLFIPLLNGGVLSTLDVRSVGLEPIARFLADQQITVVYLSPIVVRFLADALDGWNFPALRLVALGGELVDESVLTLARDLFGPTELANGFGTTETGVVSLQVFDADDLPSGPVPVGRPVPEVELLVVDDQGASVPEGETGEIVVVSPYMFAGYWGHAELSAQVIEADRAGRAGWWRYRTGDLGSLDEGVLTVRGRVDTKVKVRGRFVVLDDVEADVKALEGVADAVVGAAAPDGRTELVAVVAPRDDAALDPSGLRAHLLAASESYRVPTRWVVTETIPLLPNGKTDRRAAMALARSPTDPAGHHCEASRSETAVRTIWAEMLPVTHVDLDADFTHLGGDSLLAAQMLIRVDRELGVTVPMGELVHARTVRELAAVIDRIDDRRDAPSTVAMVQSGNGSVRDLWFVPDLHGSAYRIRHLAQALGSNQGVWSFESPLLRGERNPFPDLQAFAAHYVHDLLRARPNGPYRLAGYSFGGICAYEMARQLVTAGHEVEFLGVIDVGPGYRGPGGDGHRSPFRPWFGVAKPPAAGVSVAKVASHYRWMMQASPLGTARHLMVRTGLARLIDPVRFESDLRHHGRVRPEWRLWYAWEQHWRLAAQRWSRTNKYPGQLDLFWADESGSDDSTMGWGPLVDDLRVHRFPGDHLGILEPRGARALALALTGVLDELNG